MIEVVFETLVSNLDMSPEPLGSSSHIRWSVFEDDKGLAVSNEDNNTKAQLMKGHQNLRTINQTEPGGHTWITMIDS